ncbi:ATP-grasp domain-containing protein [Novipirellula aureliae]|uniref:ATP-grasp domain-containing protein n=1 Tax=Novipirellula aureliae TaxID=2527966 RepID=UPI0018CD40DE|nr:ATP-grasp domain-containing protein [Novipirellula aureliae]
MQQPIILIGASVRSAAESAIRGGLRVIGVDSFGDVDCRSAAEEFHALPKSGVSRQELIATLSRRFPNSPFILVGGFQDDNFLSQVLGSGRHVDCRQPEVLRLVADKANIRFPETTSSTALVSNGRWLEKSLIRTGGLGVRWFDRQTSGPSASPSSKPNASKTIRQRWIAGRRWGITYLSDGVAAVCLGVCRSLHTRKAGLPFVYGGSFGPIDLLPSQLQIANDLGQAFVQQSAYAGLFNADVIVDRDNGVWLLEINLRWTASSELVEAAMIDQGILRTGESLFATALHTSLGWVTASPGFGAMQQRIAEATKSKSRFRPRLKKIVYASRRVAFCTNRTRQYLTAAMRIRDIPAQGSNIEEGEPVVSLIVDWQRTRQADLRQAISSIGSRKV